MNRHDLLDNTRMTAPALTNRPSRSTDVERLAQRGRGGRASVARGRLERPRGRDELVGGALDHAVFTGRDATNRMMERIGHVEAAVGPEHERAARRRIVRAGELVRSGQGWQAAVAAMPSAFVPCRERLPPPW